MSAAGWIMAIGGMLAVVVLLWPAGGTRWSLRPRTGRRRRVQIPAELPAAAAALVAMVVLGLSAGHGAAAALCTAVCTAAVRVLVASGRRTAIAEGVARLANVLANQASVATTVADAVARAAPLVSGPVAPAAAALAADCEIVGIDVAAERFAARVPSEAARSLAELVAISAEGGGRWASAAAVLGAEASQAAATARLFHARVAMAMPTLALVVLLGAGLIAGAGQVATDVGAWLASSQGAALLATGATVVAVLSARILLPARAAVTAGTKR